MTLATVTVKTIATMTPDSREDNNFHEDDEPWTSMKMIAKTTPTTAMVKTIATTTAPATPDSREEDDCKYDTHNGDSEDDRDYDPRLSRGQQLLRGRLQRQHPQWQR